MEWRDILIVTVGATPPVVTETVWALLTRERNGSHDPLVPSRIHLVTTAGGRAVFETELLGPGGKLDELFRTFGHALPPVEVNLPVDKAGIELTDIRTEAECVAFANTVSRLIRRHADDARTRIHVSLAGGRKTMSYYAGAAISLFGRDQDELSHVLVTPEHLEQCTGFWWPGQPGDAVTHRWEKDDRGRPTVYSAAEGRVDAALIPFVRLKHIVTEHAFPEGEVDHARIIEAAQDSLDAQRLVLVCDAREVRAGRHAVALPHREFALYRLLAVAAKEGWRGAGPDGLGEQHRGWVSYDQLLRPDGRALARFLEFYDDAFRVGTREAQEFKDTVTNKLAAGLIDEARRPFTEARSKLNGLLRRAVPNAAIRQRLLVQSASRDPARLGLLIEPQQIEIR